MNEQANILMGGAGQDSPSLEGAACGLEQVVQPADATEQPMPRTNRGWFKGGDLRINREGRPKGSKSASEDLDASVDRAPKADRLKVLRMPVQDLMHRLSNKLAPWLTNLPDDLEIVACRVDPAQESLLFIVRSQRFPRIMKDSPIPEFEPALNGLLWRRRGSN